MKRTLNKLRLAFLNITVEPVLFSYAFAMGLHFITNETLLVEKVCRTQRNYGDKICDHLLSDANLVDEKKLVQQDVAQWVTTISYVINIPTLFMSLLLGNWSDKHGRKFPIALTMGLRTLTYAGFLLNAVFMDSPVHWMVISWIPASLLGLFINGLCLSYISDITNVDTRTKRIAILTGISFAGIPLGSLVGGVLKEYTGFIGVYCTATTMLGLSSLYSAIFLRETRHSDSKKWQKLKDLFNPSIIKTSFQTIMKKKEGKNIKHLMVALVTLGLLNFWLSTSRIKYRYAQIMYTWGHKKYSYFFSSVSMFNKLFSMFITPMLSQKFLISDASLGIIGSTAEICANILFTNAIYSWIFILGGIVDGLYFMCGVSARSILSKSVTIHELGLAFGVASSFEALGSLIGDPLMQQMYIITVKTFPSCCFIISAAISLIVLIFSSWMSLDNLKKLKIDEYQSQKIAELNPIEERNEYHMQIRRASVNLQDVTKL